MMAPSKPTSGVPSRRSKLPQKLAPNPISNRKPSSNTEKRLKAIFKGKTMSVVGNFENCGKAVTLDDIRRYITLHGGKFESEVTEDTTHLICSIDEYKRKCGQVKKALKLGKNRCKIVAFEWLTACLSALTKRYVDPRPYNLDQIINKGKGERANIYQKRFEEGVQASKELCDERLHHVHYDKDGFEYKVILTRLSQEKRSNKVEKYILYLFESHAMPHTFMFGAKLTRQYHPTAYYREECHPMFFLDALQHFKKFFLQKTGIEWDDRLEGIIKEDTENHRWFRYTPPALGRPVGIVPLGYIRPEFREQDTPMREAGKSAVSDTVSATSSDNESRSEASDHDSTTIDSNSSTSVRPIRQLSPVWSSDEE